MWAFLPSSHWQVGGTFYQSWSSNQSSLPNAELNLNLLSDVIDDHLVLFIFDVMGIPKVFDLARLIPAL